MLLEPPLDIPQGRVLAGTGHRPDKIGSQEAKVREVIVARLLHYKPSRVISGMALGFDTWLADEALKLGVPLHCAIPFMGQEDRWPPAYQATYERILSMAQTVQILQGRSPRDLEQATQWLHERNIFMVDSADAVLACHNGDPYGGTANCVRYARARKKPVDCFDPYTL